MYEQTVCATTKTDIALALWGWGMEARDEIRENFHLFTALSIQHLETFLPQNRMSRNHRFLVPITSRTLPYQRLNSHHYFVYCIPKRATPTAFSTTGMHFQFPFGSRSSSGVFRFTRFHTSKTRTESDSVLTSMLLKISEPIYFLSLVALVILLQLEINNRDYKERIRNRDCKRSLEVIEETLQRDPDALTEEEKAYVRHHSGTAVDTCRPQTFVMTKPILSIGEYDERTAAQERIKSIRERLDRQSGQ